MTPNQKTHYQTSSPVIDGTPIRDLTNATHISDLIDFTKQKDAPGFRKLLAFLLPDFVGVLIFCMILVGFPLSFIAFAIFSSEKINFSVSSFMSLFTPYLILVFAIEASISAIIVFRDHKKKNALYARLTARHPN